MEDERTFGEEEPGDQGLSGLGPAHCFPHLNGERVERYSRKVFVGGLPPDIDEGKHTWSRRTETQWLERVGVGERQTLYHDDVFIYHNNVLVLSLIILARIR